MIYNCHQMMQACNIFKKLGNRPGFEITRPEVECLWTVEVDNEPNSKQLKKLQQLGWYYDADKQTFSQYF
jgi:hypothetical protein